MSHFTLEGKERGGQARHGGMGGASDLAARDAIGGVHRVSLVPRPVGSMAKRGGVFNLLHRGATIQKMQSVLIRALVIAAIGMTAFWLCTYALRFF